jgi:hypothetical protein
MTDAHTGHGVQQVPCLTVTSQSLGESLTSCVGQLKPAGPRRSVLCSVPSADAAVTGHGLGYPDCIHPWLSISKINYT